MAAPINKLRLGAREDELYAAPGSTLVTIRTGSGSQAPLFCVHAEAGDVSLYCGLARHLATDRMVLGLRAPAVDELAAPWRLEQLAQRHVREIRTAQAVGPYAIVGECTGGALAFEIARQLRAAGEQISLLAVIDAWAPGLPHLSPLVPKPAYRVAHRSRVLGFHLANLVRLGTAERLTYVSTKAQRASRALAAKAAAARDRSAARPPLLFREALAAYEPQRYPGPIVILRAARLPLGIEASPDLGWGELVDDVRVEMIPGYFTTPISEPGVRVLAERLSRRLDERVSDA